VQRNHLTSNPIPGIAALALAIRAFIMMETGSLREALDLALSRQEAIVPSITVRPSARTPGLELGQCHPPGISIEEA